MRLMGLLRLVFIVNMFAFYNHVLADVSLTPTVLAEGLNKPWSMAQVSENHLLITQKSGTLVLFGMVSETTSPVVGAPDVVVVGQGGLLDVAVPPDYKLGDEQLGWVYFTYAAPVGKLASTALGRAKLNASLTALQDWETLLVTQSAGDEGRHFGSRIAFIGDYVFFGVGDRGHRENGQNLLTHAGAILRLHRDGRVPKDNPFVGVADVLPEIWSYGHRNPQGLALRKGQLWGSEHGPRGGDELNKIQKGGNYGWPEVSLGKEYWGPLSVGEESKPGMIDPVKAYIPSIAPSGLIVVKSPRYGWEGDFLLGALKLKHLNRLVMRADQVVQEKRYFEDQGERIRDVLEDSKGRLWIITDSGKLWQLQ